jgi:thioredoxin 1
MALFNRRTKPVALEYPEQIDDLARSGRPVLVDFFQHGCSPCQVMDGIINELADEYSGSAHVVKANAANVPEAFMRFKVKSTPTFIVFTGRPDANQITQRWRASGLVKKDVLVRTLASAGAVAAEG